MGSLTRFFAVSAAVVGIFGCGNHTGAGPSVLVRDSAGMRIVENRGDPAASTLAWRVSSAPAVDIGGGADGKLYRAMGAARLSDGRVVVANSSTIEVFGRDGKHLQSIGRSGGGPGEFRALLWVGKVPGDSILAWDSGLSRLSVFDPAGRLARTTAPRQPLGMFPQAAGALADGRVLLALRSGPAAASGRTTVQRDSVTYVVLGPNGDLQRVARVPGSEMLVSTSSGFFMRPLPFGRQTIATAHANRIYIGTGDRFEILAYEPPHGVRAIVRAEAPHVRVTRSEIEDYQRSLVTLGAEGDARARSLDHQVLSEAPYPSEMPPFTDLKVDPDGNLWLQGPKAPSAAESRWTVFSSEGRALGVVTLPGDLVVHEIGNDWVLGTAVDENQVEHVRLHRLEKHD